MIKISPTPTPNPMQKSSHCFMRIKPNYGLVKCGEEGRSVRFFLLPAGARELMNMVMVAMSVSFSVLLQPY